MSVEAVQEKRVLEALLFATTEPLSVQELYDRVEGDPDIAAILLELKGEYSQRGVNLIELEGKWAFRTAMDLADSLTLEKTVKRKLSRAAMETLAIIAYHQPITRSEVENIRGVSTTRGTIDLLMEIGWIKPGRRREVPGRPLTWVTCTSFLDHFALSGLMDLPGLDELKANGLLDRRPSIETIPATGELFDEDEEMAQKDSDNLSDQKEEE